MTEMFSDDLEEQVILDVLRKGRREGWGFLDDLDDDEDEDYHGESTVLPSAYIKREEAQKQARGHSEKIFEYHNRLRAIMERHEETIRKRWVKKSTEQRRQILQAAWNRPNMATSHRPDFYAIQKDTKKYRSKLKSTETLDHYMWPTINLEDLSRGKTMLLFLSTRARNAPHEFVHSDYNNAAIGSGVGVITTPFCAGSLLVAGRTSPDTYGVLADDDHDEDGRLRAAWVDFPVGEGIKALEIQHEIYRFLLKCSQEILSHIPISELIDAKFPILPQPDMVVLNDGPFTSLASIAAEAPYRLSSRLDFERLQDLAAANRAQAEDHIWSLREDPGYFLDRCAEESEHVLHILPNRKGKSPLEFMSPSSHWDIVLKTVATEPYESYMWADMLYSHVTQLATLARKHEAQIYAGSPLALPKDFELEFQQLDYFLKQAIGELCKTMTCAIASPPLRSHFYGTGAGSGASFRLSIKRKTPHRHDELLDILQWLSNDKNSPFDMDKGFGTCMLMDIYHHLLKQKPEQQKRISAWVDRKASELALYTEFWRQLTLFQPWVLSMDKKMENKFYAKMIQDEYNRRSRPLFEPFLNAQKVPSFAQWGYPAKRLFSYPCDKRRTEQTVDAMRKAEENLDNFWYHFDIYLTNNQGRSHHQFLVNNKFTSRELRRTPEWIEPIPQPKPIAVSKKAESDDVQSSFSSLLLDDDPAKPTVQPPRIKPKTRGVPDPSTTSQISAEPATESNTVTDVPAMKFSVPKRAHKTFSTLFFIPSTNDKPGEVAWTDFLYAMVAVGFEPEKLYGSIWQFTPGQELREKLRECGKERSIQFHEPHPAAKFPYTVARRIGRRLERAYGWSGEAFVLA